MSLRHTVEVYPRSGGKLAFPNVKTITLIDDESHGPAAIGKELISGEVRLLVCSPAVTAVRIEAA